MRAEPRIPPVYSPRRNDALCAPIGDSGLALPPPLGVVAPHRISRLVTESAFALRRVARASRPGRPAPAPTVRVAKSVVRQGLAPVQSKKEIYLEFSGKYETKLAINSLHAWFHS